MDEITFEDMLFHYEGKLREAAEEIQNLRNQLKRITAEFDGVWKGQAAETCRVKLETIDNELNKSNNELSEALIKLSAVGELLADESL